MKQANRINQYLIKNYPLVWNTKLVWLMLAGLFFHVMFFGLGFLNLNNPESLQAYNVENDFMNNGVVLLNMLVSTISIVGWLFFMFKNNSFKNFYPTSNGQLFKHFVLYFIIIIFNISYYYSFFYGMKASVKLNHPNLVVEKDIDFANQAAPFFSHYFDQYEIDNKQYPVYLNDLFCETKSALINFEKPHFSFLEEGYQFYTLYSVEKDPRKRVSNPPIFRNRINDSIALFYYKDTVIDVSKDILTSVPSYHNFSSVFFNQDDVYRYSYNYNTKNSQNRKFRKDSLNAQLVQFHHNLLTRNNSTEIKSVLENVLSVAHKYQITTNLTTENWFPLIHTDSFLIKNLIRNEAPRKNHHYQSWDRKQRERNSNAYDANGNRLKTIRDEYISKLETDYYIESDKLGNIFSNIKRVKAKNPFKDTIHFFMWFSFFLTSLIFIYRTAGLKSLIFSIISVGILCILLIMIALICESFFQPTASNRIEKIMVVITWMLGTLILMIPIFYLNRTNKMISSICINISVTFFALYVLLILAIITIFQDYICDLNYPRSSYDFRKEHCHNILQDVGIYWSYILFVVAFVFIYFFAGIIRKWRALPENK